MSFCNYKEFTCAHEGCGRIIVLRLDQEQRLRETHGTFYCSDGHSQGFYGKNAYEREIDDLKEKLERQRKHTRDAYDWVHEVRQEGLICQWPGCREHSYADVGSLRRHMQKQHGMPKDREWAEAQELQGAH